MSYALDLSESMFSQTSNTDTPSSALAELSEVYRQIGYDSGYAQATRDHLEMFVANAEAVLADRACQSNSSATERDAARRFLYSFIARLERRMGQFGLNHGVNVDAEDDRPLIDQEEPHLVGGLGI